MVAFGAARLLVIENSEPALHAVLEAAQDQSNPTPQISGRIADIRDRARIMGLVAQFKPDMVFHAAALKHVPLLETDWDEGIKTNVLRLDQCRGRRGRGWRRGHGDDLHRQGDRAGLRAGRHQASGGNVLRGARQRIGAAMPAGKSATRMISVRFGNVLASNGSVVPKFKAQIEAGGPVTVTHPDMVRYFMTIREACDLVITAATHALGPDSGDVSVYLLNMGQPVKIVDLAERIIRLSGLEPGRDIQIAFTGIRPGERLHEILFARDEETTEIGIPGIVATKPVQPSLEAIRGWVATLEQGLARNERAVIYNVLRDAVPEFRGEAA